MPRENHVASPILRNERFHEKKPNKLGDDRSPAQRDRDRLLYSGAFQRLAEVTQVVTASSGYVFHNRLTHSLQVAQVGRRLAEKLLLNPMLKDASDVNFSGIDPDVVEAACLAHDIGPPPFGHVIEEELNTLAQSAGGFEGNAQSFRILCKLAFRSHKYRGLDLTRATLAAVLKYPWLRGENPRKPNKWGAYRSESEDFLFAREIHPIDNEQTAEAFIMDWADDITYSVHDLEDFHKAGRIPLYLLAQEDTRESDYFYENVYERHSLLPGSPLRARLPELREVLSGLLLASFPTTEEYRGTERQRANLKNFTGFLIGRYINGVSVNEDNGRLSLQVDPQFKDEVSMLKELIWTYVIQDPALASQQVGQRHMVKTLYEVYTDASSSRASWNIFPPYFRERLDQSDSNNDEDRIRTCVDLISGFTETQVHRVYGRLTGSASEASLQDPLK